MTTFDDVIREFHKKRLEREIYAVQVRQERTRQLQEMASLADTELRQRRRRKSALS